MSHRERVYSVVFSGASVDSDPDGVLLESNGYTRRTPMGKQAAHASSGDQCSVSF
jgi:hypothetical protein